MVYGEAKKNIGLKKIKGPYLGARNFQGGVFGAIYPLVKYDDVILSSLGYPLPPPRFHVNVLIQSEKTSGSETLKAHTRGPGLFRVDFGQSTTPPVKT